MMRSLLLLALVAGGAGVFWRYQHPAEEAASGPRPEITRVRRGPLTITVAAQGTIAAKRAVRVAHRVPGVLTITELVPAGTLVEKGDVLVRFDTGKLRDNLRSAKTRLQNARTSHEIAGRELEILKRQNAEEVRSAEVGRATAQLELEKYEQGASPAKLRELELKIEEAISNLERAKESYESICDPELLEQGYVIKSQIEEERLKLRTAESKLILARDEIRVFKAYTRPIELKSKQDALAKAEAEIEKLKSIHTNKLKQKAVDLSQKLETVREGERDVATAERDIAGAALTAPRSGLVIHGDQSRDRRREEKEYGVGTDIRQNESVITIPDLNLLIIKAQVPESDIARVKVGMPASISSDSYPDMSLTGTVSKIGNVPTKRWFAHTQTFDITIELPRGTEGLKPGVSARAEILSEQVEDALSVPVSAVFTREGRSFVYAPGPEGPRALPVDLGVMSETRVVVLSGLSEDDEVFLAAPEDAPGLPAAPAEAQAEPSPIAER